MKLKLIAAVGKNNELGNKNDLPLWNLRTDQKRFRDLTTGGIVVMGRKTYESFPEKFRPLPNRRNIILTRDENYKVEGAESFRSLEEALPHLALKYKCTLASPYKGEEESSIWIIGGGEIYRQFVHKVDELHITHVDGEFTADTHFPPIDESIWKKISEEKVEADEKNSHTTTYIIYAKRT